MGRATGSRVDSTNPEAVRRLLTLDKGFEFEHNVEQLSFGIIILEAANNQMPSYERLLERLVQQIQRVAPGHVARVSDPDR